MQYSPDLYIYLCFTWHNRGHSNQCWTVTLIFSQFISNVPFYSFLCHNNTDFNDSFSYLAPYQHYIANLNQTFEEYVQLEIALCRFCLILQLGNCVQSIPSLKIRTSAHIFPSSSTFQIVLMLPHINMPFLLSFSVRLALIVKVQQLL